MKISDLSDWKLTKTNAEKIAEIFDKKRASFNYERRNAQQFWYSYLDSLEGVEHIRKFSDYASPLDYLLEAINSNLPFNKFIIKVEGHDQFLLIDKDFAEKVLVLGHLP